MSMCYLCDLCARKSDARHYSFYEVRCDLGHHIEFRHPLVIDYGRDDPKSICKHFERKDGGERKSPTCYVAARSCL